MWAKAYVRAILRDAEGQKTEVFQGLSGFRIFPEPGGCYTLPKACEGKNWAEAYDVPLLYTFFEKKQWFSGKAGAFSFRGRADGRVPSLQFAS